MLGNLNSDNAQTVPQSGQNLTNSTDTIHLPPEVVTNLFAAVNQGDLSKLQGIIAKFRLTSEVLNQLKDENGNNVLLIAAAQGKIEIMNYLIESCQVDINLNNQLGENALLIAARYDQIAVVNSLLGKHGIKKDSKDIEGNNALLIAAAHGNIRTLNVLLSLFKFTLNREGYNIFCVCAKHGQIDALKWLIQYDSSFHDRIRSQDPFLITNCLNAAAKFGQNAMIDFLVHNYCHNKNLSKSRRQDLMLICVECGQLDTLKYLIETHNYLKLEDLERYSLWYTALDFCQLEIFDYLLKESEQSVDQALINAMDLSDVSIRNKVIIHILYNYQYSFSVIEACTVQLSSIPEIQPALKTMKKSFWDLTLSPNKLANLLKNLDPLNRKILFNCKQKDFTLAEFCFRKRDISFLTILFSYGLDPETILSKEEDFALESEIKRTHALIRLTEAKYDPLLCQEFVSIEGGSPVYLLGIDLLKSFFHMQVEEESEENQYDLSTNIQLKKLLLKHLMGHLDLIDRRIIFHGLVSHALYASPSNDSKEIMPKDIVLACTLTEKEKQDLINKTHLMKLGYLAQMASCSPEDNSVFCKFLGDDIECIRNEKEGFGWRNLNQHLVYVLSNVLREKNVFQRESTEEVSQATPTAESKLTYSQFAEDNLINNTALNRILPRPYAYGEPATERSPLHLVTSQLLCAAKDADIEETDRLINILKAKNDTNIIEVLKNIKHEEYDILLLATAYGHIDYIEHLFKKYNYPVEVLNKRGQNVLLVAIEYNQIEVLKRCFADHLIRDAKNAFRDEYGDCPVLTAVRVGHIEILKYLLELGYTLDTDNNDGHDPLLVAIAYDRLEIFKYLISQGCSTNKNGAFGIALDVAAEYGQTRMIDYLIDHYQFLMNGSRLDMSKLKEALNQKCEEIQNCERSEKRKWLISLKHMLFKYSDIELLEDVDFFNLLVEMIPDLQKIQKKSKLLAVAITQNDQNTIYKRIVELREIHSEDTLPQWRVNRLNFAELCFKYNNAKALEQLILEGFSPHCLLSKSLTNDFKHQVMSAYILLRSLYGCALKDRSELINLERKEQQIAQAFLGATTVETDQIEMSEEFKAALLANILQDMDVTDKNIIRKGLENGTFYAGLGEAEDLKNIVLSNTLSPDEKEQRNMDNKSLCLVYQAELWGEFNVELNHSLAKYTGITKLQQRTAEEPYEMFLYAIRKLNKQQSVQSAKGKEKAIKVCYK